MSRVKIMDNGIWYGYLAGGILVVVAFVLGYLDRRSRKKERHAH
jgi:hypothetical protein